MEMKYVWALTGLFFAAGLGTARGYAEEPKAEPSAADAALTELDEAMALAKSDPKKAGPVLKKLLTRLSKKDAIPEGSHQHVKRYNLALTAAHRLGVRLSAKYRTKEHRAQKGMLVFDVPTRTGWEKRRLKRSDQLLRVGRATGTKQTVLTIESLDATQLYNFPDGTSLRGSDLKGVLGKKLRFWKENVHVLTSTKSARSITRKLGKSVGFEGYAENTEGTKYRMRQWCTKSKKDSKIVYVITVAEYDYAETEDPETELLLRSLREKPKK